MRKLLLVWAMVLGVLGFAACATVEEMKGTPSRDEFIQTLVSQSPWQGTWSGRDPNIQRWIAGTFELVFKMEDGGISAVIQNTSGSVTTTKFDGSAEVKIKGNRIELKELLAGTVYELKLDKENKLVGTMYPPRGSTTLDVEFRPAKK